MNEQISSPKAAQGSPTLAVVAIAKNERRDIEGFVRHLQDWADEIVVVDDFSTDGTYEFLNSCGSKVKAFQRKLEREGGGFAAQRNAGLAEARADWILHMDVDERVTPELAAEIRKAIVTDHYDAFRYHRLNFFLHRPFNAGGWQSWNAAQLGRRGRHRFTGAIHEAVEVDGGQDRIGQLGSSMWHLNDESYVERMYKNAHYAQFSADQIGQSGKRVGWRQLLFVPMYRALKSYFLRGAWRHGETGLLFSLYVFAGTFNWYAIAWDRQKQIPRQQIEESLEQKWRQWRAENEG